MIRIIITLTFFILSITFGFSQKQWSLQECVAYALENNISIKKATLNTNYSKENSTIAKARLLPNANANASQNLDINSKYERVNPSNSFGVSASIDLYNGGRNKLLLTQANNTVATNTVNLETLQSTISLQIANYYLNVLFNKENIKIAKEQIEITNTQLTKMQELIDAGVKPKADLLNIQATLANNKEQLSTAENALDLSLLNLAQLIQIPSTGFDVQEVTIHLDKAVLLYSDTDAIYTKAVNNRPEIRKVILDIENAELGVKIAKTNLKPSISMHYGLNTSYRYIFSGDGAFDKRLDQYNDNHGHNFGITARYTIFDGKSTRASITKAKINKEIIEHNLLEEKLKLRETIERSYLDAKASLKQYEASLSSLKSQEESFKIAQERYKLGAMNSFDFDLVKSKLFNAKSSVNNAKYNFVFKSKVLDYYNGIPIVIE